MSDYAAYLARRDFPAVLAAHTVEVGDCLEWIGAYGHGNTSAVPIIKSRGSKGGKNFIIPRLVWLHAHGEIPDGRIVYRHLCCNDRCVKLEHLKVGRRGDQNRRRAALGLAGHMQSTRANLTHAARNRSTTKHSEAQAAAVRELVTAGVPDILIAGATDVSPSMVADIRLGRAWGAQTHAASIFNWRPAA